MNEGIRRCKCGGWVHRARECGTCKILEGRYEPVDTAIATAITVIKT